MNRRRVMGAIVMIYGALVSQSALALVARPQARAVFADTPVLVDGDLGDVAWRAAPWQGDFVERKPELRAQPMDKTRFKVLFDAEALYIAVELLDAQPHAIQAHVVNRDDMSIFRDDAISIKLDTANDRRTTLGFVLNPSDGRVDYRGIDEAQFRPEFDAVWTGASKRLAQGWSCEFRLPWGSLELDPANLPSRIGLNLSRDHPRRNATYDWALMPPPFTPVSASLYGDLRGFTEAKEALRDAGVKPRIVNDWHLLAYGLGGFSSEPSGEEDTRADLYDPLYNGGLDAAVDFGDVRVDLTLNTDFAQVELDNQVANLSRFSLFMPEKRDFFLSNMELFTFGQRGRNQILHTRRIGLDGGNEVPLLTGAKLSSQADDVFRMGVLQVTTRPTDDVPWTSHTVGRGQFELGGGSNLGFMVTHRQSLDQIDDRNVVVGVDGAWRGDGTPMLVTGFAALSETSSMDDPARLGALGSIKVKWRGEVVRPELRYTFVHEDFEADLGYVQRTNVHMLKPELEFEPRPKAHGLEKIRIKLTHNSVLAGDTGDLLDWNVRTYAAVHWKRGYVAALTLRYDSETVLEAFGVGTETTIDPGAYHLMSAEVGVRTPGNQPVSVSAAAFGREYYGGAMLGGEMALTIRPVDAFRLEASGTYYNVSFKDERPDFQIGLVNASATVGVTTDVMLRTQVGYNHLDDLIQLQTRLRWTYWPGSDLFLVYQADVSARQGFIRYQSLQAKLTFRYPWG